MHTTNEFTAALRIGKVTQFDPNKMRARVNFPDMNIISYWLPLLVMNTLKTKDEYFLDVGEHVICLMQGQGTETGFILGAIYDDNNLPKVRDKEKNTRVVTFDDGTQLSYNRKTHTLKVDTTPEGIITVKGKNISVDAENVTLTAGHITLTGGVIELDGSVVCPGYCRC